MPEKKEQKNRFDDCAFWVFKGSYVHFDPQVTMPIAESYSISKE